MPFQEKLVIGLSGDEIYWRHSPEESYPTFCVIALMYKAFLRDD
jgi:hypothetical protein